MNNLSGIISIAKKAGYVIVGQDTLKGYDKKLYLLLIDKTAGKSLKREMNFLAKNKEIPIFEIENLPEISKIENCKILGIKNKNLSDSIIKILKGE